MFLFVWSHIITLPALSLTLTSTIHSTMADIDRKDDIVEMETVPSRFDNQAKVEDEQMVFDSKFAHMGFR